MQTTPTPTVAELADHLVCAFISLTPREARLVVSAYRLLCGGAPVELGAVADAAGWSSDEVERRFASWPGVYLDGAGRLVGLWGIATEAVSEHRLDIDGQGTVWTWCAFDPLFLVPILGARGRVDSRCPTTAQPVKLTVDADGIRGVAPESAVVSFLLPDGPFDAEVRQTFCHFVHFFNSPAAADSWTADHPGTFWLSVADAAEVGRRLAREVFPNTPQL